MADAQVGTDNSSNNSRTIILTGFTAFDHFKTNPSGIIVRRIEREGLGKIGVNLKLITEVLNVAYDEVESVIPKLWSDHNPDLVIHLGVHQRTHLITLEQQSSKVYYCLPDVKCNVPANHTCPDSLCKFQAENICSGFDCKLIAKNVSENIPYKCIKIESSNDPGRYLCAYAYYISLNRSREKSLFVHIPEFDEICTEEVLINIVKEIIRICLDHLKN